MAPSGRSSGYATVTPGDCALAVCLPVQREDFLRDLNDPNSWDYAPSLMRRHVRMDREFLWALYDAQLAGAIRSHCDYVAQSGVTVCRTTSREDLHRLLASGAYNVVTLISHSRWSPLELADVRDPDRFRQAIRDGAASGSAVLSQLVRVLDERLPPVPRGGATTSGACSEEDDGQAVVRVVSELAQEAHAFYNQFDSREDRHEEVPSLTENLWYWVRQWFSSSPSTQSFPGPSAVEGRELHPGKLFTRALLEQCLPGELRPCRSVEFRDGLATAGEFLRAIPHSFGGVLDLSFCSSALHCIAMSDPDRPYLVAMSRRVLRPRFQLIIHRLVIETIRREPQPYLEAQDSVRRRCIHELRELDR